MLKIRGRHKSRNHFWGSCVVFCKTTSPPFTEDTLFHWLSFILSPIALVFNWRLQSSELNPLFQFIHQCDPHHANSPKKKGPHHLERSPQQYEECQNSCNDIGHWSAHQGRAREIWMIRLWGASYVGWGEGRGWVMICCSISGHPGTPALSIHPSIVIPPSPFPPSIPPQSTHPIKQLRHRGQICRLYSSVCE